MDDSQRTNKIKLLSSKERLELARHLRTSSPPRFMRVTDRSGRQVQDVVKVKKVFEGAHLDNAVKRARRHLRSRRHLKPPAHIMLALAVYSRADPEGFKRQLESPT